MMVENTETDKKSIRTVTGRTADFGEIAKDCVAFANARGGALLIGIEDEDDMPPAEQRINENLPDSIVKRINELTVNVGLAAQKVVASNGGEYVKLSVFPSRSSIAATNKGQYYIRMSDECHAVMPDELARLFSDKSSFDWETRVTAKRKWTEGDSDKVSRLIQRLREAPERRVSSFVKQKDTPEILAHYQLIDDDGNMTNLGVMWIGTASQRARLLYAPTVQYIKYDAQGRKVDKVYWNDYSMNPLELLESIWTTVPDWRESIEVAEGLWRKSIPAYDEKVVREVLCNALIHRPYTTRGDIFVNIHPDRMTVVNPGLLPIGITPQNILQKSEQRNPHMSNLCFALGMMEAEGSGWDMMYRTLLSAGKEVPLPEEGDDSVSVTIRRDVIAPEASRLCDYMAMTYADSISPKNMIALGLIAQVPNIKASELTHRLQLRSPEMLSSYLSFLIENSIVLQSGRGKGVAYQLNPAIEQQMKLNTPTTLRTLEPYVLETLIKQDLKKHPLSTLAEMEQRLKGVDFEQLQKMVRAMASKGELTTSGGRKYRRYSL